MNKLVLDGSIALSWVLPDEVNDRTEGIKADIAGGCQTFVPSHWALEVANALCVAERRRRISQAETTAALAAFANIHLAEDTETGRRAGHETLALARQFALSVYDAAYLELAMRHGATLASLDGPLRAAARKLKVPVRPEHL